ncbi:MAG TPA: ATP-binding protein [Ktedonobacteraceae bacterium]|nr:ATP-binding protein [Ktedonobacteraceae bacterium]
MHNISEPEIRRTLATLYDTTDKAKLVAEDISLPLARIPFAHSMEVCWSNIWKEAKLQHKELNLIDRVLLDYSSDEKLAHIRDQIIQRDGGSKENGIVDKDAASRQGSDGSHHSQLSHDQSLEGRAIILDNPFTYGNPISDKTRFFGRSDEINQVLGRLRNAEFESSSLVGERRIGKTSLLNYLQHLSVRRSYGLDPEKYIFIYMDLQLVGNKDLTPVRLWQEFLDSMRKSCQYIEVIDIVDDTIKKLAKQKETAPVDGSVLSDLFSKLKKKNHYMVFLLDEFEQITSNENFDSDFFNLLRSLAIGYPLALITCSRSGLLDLCHSNAIRSSPFFNIFAPVFVQSFDEDEARNLISRLLSRTNIRFTDVDMNAIFHIAGTHPYFLQMACSCLFNAYSEKSCPDKHAFMYKKFEELSTQQLAYYWHHSGDGEKIVLTALALSEQQQKIKELGFTVRNHVEITSRSVLCHFLPPSLRKLFSQGSLKQMEELYLRYGRALKRLEERSLVISKAGTYYPFSAFFSEWIYKEITDTMQDKQSYKEWLESDKTMQIRLLKVGKGISEILPKVNSKYREMIVTWASDPKNVVIIAELLKATLGRR